MRPAYGKEIDLDTYTFEEFVTFVFDHPVPQGKLDGTETVENRETRWYHTKAWRHGGTPETIIAHLIRLYSDPAGRLESYTAAQLDEGFWYLGGSKYGRMLWEEEIDLDLRCAYVRSMLPLAAKLFAKEPLNLVCFMWWDFFLNLGAADSGEAKLKDEITGVLEEILGLPSQDCQLSALHGFGHLEHPRKREIVEAFLARHSDMDTDLRTFAEIAIRGGML